MWHQQKSRWASIRQMLHRHIVLMSVNEANIASAHCPDGHRWGRYCVSKSPDECQWGRYCIGASSWWVPMWQMLHRHIILMSVNEADVASAKVLMSVNEADAASAYHPDECQWGRCCIGTLSWWAPVSQVLHRRIGQWVSMGQMCLRQKLRWVFIKIMAIS